MGAQCSSDNLKRIFRCSKCKMHQKMRQSADKKTSESPKIDQQILKAFFNLADDPIYISRRQFEECFGHALGPALWQYLQGEDKKTMDCGEFERQGKMLKEMPLDNYARMGMHPSKLLNACLESCQIGTDEESPKDVEFLQKLGEQMGNSPAEIIAWKERNCPRLLQSIHENVLNKFLGIPKSVIEESKLEESALLSAVQMFFLKHNLPRNVFFEKRDGADEEGENKGKGGWTKLYESQKQGMGAESFEQNVFPFDGSTISLFQMANGEMLVLAADEQFRNGNRPFGGPYTILFKFEPEFQRIEKDPPALHCNFRHWANSLFFNGGSILALKNDFSNVKAIEVWGCARREATEMAMPKMDEEERKILEKRKPRGEENGGGKVRRKRRENATEQWAENADKELMEMAGFTFSDNRRGGGKGETRK